MSWVFPSNTLSVEIPRQHYDKVAALVRSKPFWTLLASSGQKGRLYAMILDNAFLSTASSLYTRLHLKTLLPWFLLFVSESSHPAGVNNQRRRRCSYFLEDPDIGRY